MSPGLALHRPDLPDLFAGSIAGTSPEAEWDVVRLAERIRRLYRWDVRALLAISGALGRPIARTFVDRAMGRIRGAAVWTAGPRAGWIAALALAPDAPSRRTLSVLVERGLEETRRQGGRSLLVPEAAAPRIPETGEVLRSLGFTIAGAYRTWRRELSEGTVLARADPGVRRRPTARDRDRIVAWARATRPIGIERREPLRATDLALGRTVSAALGSRSLALLEDGGSGPVAFVRVTLSEASRSAHVSVLSDPGAPPGTGRGALAGALAWAREAGAVRAIASTSEGGDPADAGLIGSGFEPSGRSLTWASPVEGAG